MNIVQFLQRAALSTPLGPAVLDGDKLVYDYAGLAARVAKIAYGLRANLLLNPGDRVALAMKNCPEYIELLLATWYAGLAVVPINAKLHHDEFAFILENSEARACFVTADLTSTVGPLANTVETLETVIVAGSTEHNCLAASDTSAMPEPRAPDDLAWLFYTSGTTGVPKGAMLTHRNLLSMGLSYCTDVDHVTASDMILHAAPMSHGSGLYIVPHLIARAANIVPASGGFDPAEIFDLLSRFEGISMFAAPTMVKRMVDFAERERAEPGGLKLIVYGGAPMYAADLFRALACFDGRLAQIYGQGESPMTITCLSRGEHLDRTNPRFEARMASVGVAQAVVEVCIADEDGKPLPPGQKGEILVRGDVVMKGYWRDEAATAETLHDGWLHTGDVGSFDDAGFLNLHDRAKDLIISGGTNIYPREVEEVLLRHPDIREVGVVGRPHPDWGEEVVAFVVSQGTKDPGVLDAFCLKHMARFKRPKHYKFVDDLPKNNYGKIVKTGLRQLAADDTR